MTRAELYDYEFRLLRVIDGDTIQAMIDLGFRLYMKENVRLFGVDAPELRTPTRIEGEEAKAFVQNWFWKRNGLIADTTYMLRSNKFMPHDKYGRVLGTVFAEGDPVSLNQALLDAGHVASMP